MDSCTQQQYPTKDHHSSPSEVKKFINCCGRTTATIQTDGEVAIKALAAATIKDQGGNSIGIRTSPAYSSASQGSVERSHQTVQAQMGALLQHCKLQTGFDAAAKHPLTTWATRHAAFLISRYLVHIDGQTSYARRWGRNYTTPRCCFGEHIHCRFATRHVSKHQPQWTAGVWLGRDDESNEHIVAVDNTIIKTRTSQRMTPDAQWHGDKLEQLAGLPWAPRGSQHPEPFFLGKAQPTASTGTSTHDAERHTKRQRQR